MIDRRNVIKALGVGVAAALAPFRSRAASDRTATTVSGPIHGGRHGWPFGGFLGDLSALGYVEEEYFIEGHARNFRPVGELGLNGRWNVAAVGTAPYRTRLLVRRPRDPAKFNGTVLLEWINVTLGFDLQTIGLQAPSVYADGFAVVTASCQHAGIYGFKRNPQGLKVWDPERYGALFQAGDSFSYDIFTQAGRAVGPHRSHAGVDPLSGLAVRKVIATGASQSAVRLTTYINAIHRHANVFDAIVPVLNFGAGAGFDNRIMDPSERPPVLSRHSIGTPTRLRDDLDIPVMVVNSEFETLIYLHSRQPDTDHFRFWETAGASHAPGPTDRYQAQLFKRDGLEVPPQDGRPSEVDWHPTAAAAFHHVHRWINGGAPPPHQARIEVEQRDVPRIIRDLYGNARGGVRLPELEVPIARYSGTAHQAGVVPLFGSTTPFSPDVLRRLYPTRESYVTRVAGSAHAAAQSGVIMPWRVQEYIERARQTPLPI